MLTKISRILLAVCLTAAIVLSLSSCGFVSYRGSTYSDARNSVVLIHSVDAFGREWIGSGFAIGEPGKPIQYIVTNHHCVFEGQYVIDYDGTVYYNPFYNEKMSVTVYFSAAANNFMRAEIYREDYSKDLAVLRLPEPTTERQAMIFSPMKDTDINGQFWAYGYPWTARLGGQDYMKFDQSDIAATSGGIQRSARVSNNIVKDADVYILDLAIHGGNSGGPLVNSRGEVVGINTFSSTEDGDIWVNFAVAVDELMRIIPKNEIHYTVVGDLRITNIVILAAGIIIVIILAVVLISVASGNKKKSVPAAFAGMPGQPQPYGAPPVQPVQAASAQKAYIRGVSGIMAGRNFEIGQRIVIGRDGSSCAVAYPVDTAGISGLHCEIAFSSGIAFLKDLGSSYGTFLATGAKLTANSPVKLNQGDKFYVANPENTFEFMVI